MFGFLSSGFVNSQRLQPLEGQRAGLGSDELVAAIDLSILQRPQAFAEASPTATFVVRPKEVGQRRYRDIARDFFAGAAIGLNRCDGRLVAFVDPNALSPRREEPTSRGSITRWYEWVPSVDLQPPFHPADPEGTERVG